MSLVRTLTWAVAGLGALATAGALAYFPAVEWDGLPFAPVGGIVAASVAAAVALTVNETVDQRRTREMAANERAHKEAVRVRREQVYSDLLHHMVRSFTGGPPTGDEARVRASIAVWGSQQLVQRLTDWYSLTGKILDQHEGNVPASSRPELQGLVGDIAYLARSDLGLTGEEPSPAQLAAMIFNDFSDVA